MTRTIKTERLVLRPMTIDDTSEIATLVGEYEVSRWLTRVPHPYTVADGEEFVNEIAGERDFAICAGDELVGVVGVGSAGELGYWLGKPFWGRGFMTEAASAIVDEWFSKDSPLLDSGYFTDNHRSGAVLAKLGFKPTEIGRDESLARRCSVEIQRVELTRSGWQKQTD